MARVKCTKKEENSLKYAINSLEIALEALDAAKRHREAAGYMDRKIHVNQIKDQLSELKSILRSGWAG